MHRIADDDKKNTRRKSGVIKVKEKMLEQIRSTIVPMAVTLRRSRSSEILGESLLDRYSPKRENEMRAPRRYSNRNRKFGIDIRISKNCVSLIGSTR